MKAKTQIPSIGVIIAVLTLLFQSCGVQKIVQLTHLPDELRPDTYCNGIQHLKDCPVVSKERTVFFEEHLYEPNSASCMYCHQKKITQTVALDKTEQLKMPLSWH